jgi:hypothetical protein
VPLLAAGANKRRAARLALHQFNLNKKVDSRSAKEHRVLMIFVSRAPCPLLLWLSISICTAFICIHQSAVLSAGWLTDCCWVSGEKESQRGLLGVLNVNFHHCASSFDSRTFCNQHKYYENFTSVKFANSLSFCCSWCCLKPKELLYS